MELETINLRLLTFAGQTSQVLSSHKCKWGRSGGATPAKLIGCRESALDLRQLRGHSFRVNSASMRDTNALICNSRGEANVKS